MDDTNTDVLSRVSRSLNLDGLTYQTEGLTVNLVPIIVVLFLLYFIRVFTLMGGDLDRFMDFTGLIPGADGGIGALDNTYGVPGTGAGGYNAPGSGYDTPQATYGQATYDSGNRVDFDFNIPMDGQVETFDPTQKFTQPEITMTPEELALYNQLLLSNNYMYLERLGLNQYQRKKK